MPRLLTPDLFVDSVYDIDLAALKERGIRHIITDLDNTLVPWVEKSPNPRLQEWLASLKAADFGVCLVSNAVESRVEAFRQSLGVPGIGKAAKPRNGAFLQAMELLEARPETTAVIGDQIFTDVLGGNRLGLYTILVVPLSQTEFIGTRIVRIIERFILRRLSK